MTKKAIFSLVKTKAEDTLKNGLLTFCFLLLPLIFKISELLIFARIGVAMFSDSIFWGGRWSRPRVVTKIKGKK